MCLVMCMVAIASWADTEHDKATERMEDAGQVLQEIMKAPDKGIPQEVIDHAKCIAIVPHEVKGGLRFRCRSRQRCRGVQNGKRLECTGFLHHHRWKLGRADRT